MSFDLTGIINRNEYYTNHYLADAFASRTAETVSAWRADARDDEQIKTPWSQLKSIAQKYARLHNRYSERVRVDDRVCADTRDLADLYLQAFGYGNAAPDKINYTDDLAVPIYKEIKKDNGNPYVWILLASSEEFTDNILDGYVVDDKGARADSLTGINNEDLITRIFFANQEPPRFLIFIGFNSILLADRNKWNEKRYLEFDVGEIFGRREETTFQAMSVLLHHDSLCPQDGKILLDELDEDSQRNAAGVSSDLKYALRECIELLGNEVLYDLRVNKGRDLETTPVDASQLTLECLRYMYRMLFVLFIESRPELGYAPMKADVYFKAYSLENLRSVAENIRQDLDNVGDGTYLNDSLNKLYGLIYDGYPTNDAALLQYDEAESLSHTFIIHPLKAHVFDPERTPMLTVARLRNSVLLKIIDLMSVSKGRNGHRRGRISYSNLGINQLGSVYEALLAYRGFLAQETLYEVKRKGDTFDYMDVGYFVKANELEQYDENERVRDNNGRLRTYEKGTFIYRLAGREREKSASYYTPECLTKCLVKYALKELLEGKTADEILSLKVCEPAMGSAAFLNEAINQLAEAYLDKKQQELGQMVDAKDRFTELQKVKMFIADRNIYGIDLNPVAVELAEVSLWLNTIYAGGYVPWFGTQLVAGNSLIGARRQCYEKDQITTSVQGLRWYENAPERVTLGKKRKAKQIYHFLLGDPGMSNYTDKVIRSLEPETIKKIKEWNKAFTKPYKPGEVEMLLKLSKIIDDLWLMQINARQTVENSTKDKLSFFGHEEAGAGCHETIRQRDKKYAEEYKSENKENAGPYARLKFAMDYWCSLWFWPIEKAEELPTRQQFFSDMQMILEGNMLGDSGHVHQYNLFSEDLGDAQAEDLLRMDTLFEEYKEVDLQQLCDTFPRLALAKKIAAQNRFMHWELEFADIFAERGGFDLIVGNPPWILLGWNEQGVLSDVNPMFAVKKLNTSQILAQKINCLNNDEFREDYLAEYEQITGMQAFLNAVVNYKILIGMKANLYKCFLPQAWDFSNKNGVSAFIHPEGVFDDPKGGALREKIYFRLRKHFMFANERKLFPEVHHHTTFSLNVYGGPLKTPKFDSVGGLYEVKVLEQCYEASIVKLPPYENISGFWNEQILKSRILHITQQELAIFSKLLDGTSKWETARLPFVYSQQILSVLEKFIDYRQTIKSIEDNVFTSQMINETQAQNQNLIERDIHFSNKSDEVILSGPHIGIATPFFKCSRQECILNSDYDNIDLLQINPYYSTRSNYSYKFDRYEYNDKLKTTWNISYWDSYRIFSRIMLNPTSARTLVSAILPPYVSHINGILGFAFKDMNTLISVGSLFSSLVCDFYLRATGMSNLRITTVLCFPYIKDVNDDVKVRTLMLNCLTLDYVPLWQELWSENMRKCEWSKQDLRLSNTKFGFLCKEWNMNTPLRDDYSRRQALLEIDVLIAMELGMTLEQLLTIYNVQFPIMHSYEDDTWYDSNGRIVFTVNRGLIGVGFSRQEFEAIKDAPAGQKFYRTITDDTMPGGPVERTIEYVAPFDRCDREKDYETAWKFFEEKYERRE